jgi:hypothetical protein
VSGLCELPLRMRICPVRHYRRTRAPRRLFPIASIACRLQEALAVHPGHDAVLAQGPGMAGLPRPGPADSITFGLLKVRRSNLRGRSDLCTGRTAAGKIIGVPNQYF